MISAILNVLFPRICFGCGSEGTYICGECLRKINLVPFSFCPNCKALTHRGEFCFVCAKDFELDGLIVCAKYDDGVLKEAIHEFKYDRVFDIGKILGLLLVEKLKLEYVGGCLIIPIPLSKNRLASRGFNQAEILAKVVSEQVGLPLISNTLDRTKNKKPQAELSREKRIKNLEGCFRWSGGD